MTSNFLSTNQIRSLFLDFFSSKQHQIVPSSSLVPVGDNTLLFTNAGMVQFKDVFLGLEQRSYNKATSSQKCVRAGGKHNDLENVGFTTRHHTFFEMLGNFSFGDYFKKDAIKFAWEFITNSLQIPREKLWVTVHHSDEEAFQFWVEVIGFDPQRISKCDEDNFWAMGDTGPCGPCTEIFYDRGDKFFGAPPGMGDEGDRYIEIWNLVFMQYNRDESGVLHALPKPSVDTGMGLERIASVMQGVDSNFDIDTFKFLIEKISQNLNLNNEQSKTPSVKVIADHIRAITFLIADGVIPSNEGRGYVLRRILRRAVRHGNKLGAKKPFLHNLVQYVVTIMSEAYPYLIDKQDSIASSIEKEEQLFFKTLEQGLNILNQELAKSKYDAVKVFDGHVAFTLYDTYGFPLDLSADILREKNLTIDQSAFDAAMEEQRQKAKSSQKFSSKNNIQVNPNLVSEFVGYDEYSCEAIVTQLFSSDGNVLNQLKNGNEGILTTSITPFYAESGGQVGDTGIITSSKGEFLVTDAKKIAKSILHFGKVIKGEFNLNDSVTCNIDIEKRKATVRNHTATHLLHAALRTILGEHVEQRGSLVEPNRLRFDFIHHSPLTKSEIQTIEDLVNQKILDNTESNIEEMDFDSAIKKGALAFFEEKYEDKVRVLSLGDDFSVELCGGTHAHRTGDVGGFAIVSESSVGSGVRRIEAITGIDVIRNLNNYKNIIDNISQSLKASHSNLLEKIDNLLIENKKLNNDLKNLQKNSVKKNALKIATRTIAGHEVFVDKLPNMTNVATMRELIDDLKAKFKSGVFLLGANVSEGKCTIMCSVHNINSVDAIDIVNHAAIFVGGKGGGKPNMAQAGGSKVENLEDALKKGRLYIEEKLHNEKSSKDLPETSDNNKGTGRIASR